MGQVNFDFKLLSSLLIDICSYFAISLSDPKNVEDVPFYVLQCTHAPKTLRGCKGHDWDDTIFLLGEIVVYGIYMCHAWKMLEKYRWEENRSPTTIYIFPPCSCN